MRQAVLHGHSLTTRPRPPGRRFMTPPRPPLPSLCCWQELNPPRPGKKLLVADIDYTVSSGSGAPSWEGEAGLTSGLLA